MPVKTADKNSGYGTGTHLNHDALWTARYDKSVLRWSKSKARGEQRRCQHLHKLCALVELAASFGLLDFHDVFQRCFHALLDDCFLYLAALGVRF